jgi:hypothetical protein
MLSFQLEMPGVDRLAKYYWWLEKQQPLLVVM